MTIEELKETAAMAHLNSKESEMAALLPAFSQMLDFFDKMQDADGDKAAFPAGLRPVSAAMAGASGNYRNVNCGFYRDRKLANEKNSAGFTESLLDNAGERDGRFLVVPNVL